MIVSIGIEVCGQNEAIMIPIATPIETAARIASDRWSRARRASSTAIAAADGSVDSAAASSGADGLSS